MDIEEIKALAEVLASVESTKEVRELLDRLEAGEVSVWEVIALLDDHGPDASRFLLTKLLTNSWGLGGKQGY